jgi:3-oxoacyl-[acyl-carrier-protein] synthase-1
MGIVGSIGNNVEETVASLREGRSGITKREDFEEHGMRSHVGGVPDIDVRDYVEKKVLRFMGDGVAYNAIAMEEALKSSGLEEREVKDERTGLVMGSGGPSTLNVYNAHNLVRNSGEKGSRRVSPFMVPRVMSSTNSAVLATHYGIRGVNYSLTSACATSAHCIGHAAELIQMNKQDVIFAGGGEELSWTMAIFFDAMQALSSQHNEDPPKASRPFDESRDGFVIAGGGGVVVVEEYERAKARGATIIAELVGYGTTSDGYDMVQPSGDGAVRCMKMAMAGRGDGRTYDDVNYVNAHGTSTPVGDERELEAVSQVFSGDHVPYLSSTKSLTGHSLGAAGVQEAIYTLIMQRDGFISPTINLESRMATEKRVPVVGELMEDVDLGLVMSNSFGFGGTNASLLFSKEVV